MTRKQKSEALKSSLSRVKRKKVTGTRSIYIYENGVVLNETTGYATTGRITGTSPYPKVSITYLDGTRRTAQVSRLMGEVFLKANWKENRNKWVSFKDGSKTNTRLDNLELMSAKNVMNRSSKVFGRRHNGITKNEIREIRSTYRTYKNPKVALNNLSKSYRLSSGAINRIVNRITFKNI